jgi:hypothetical protein
VIKTVAVAAFLALVTAGCAQPPDRAITLCEASASGRLKDGANLRLTSIFSTDGMQVGFFRDNDCPRVAVALFLHNAEERKPLDDQIDAASGIGQPIQRYRLDVSGVFHEQHQGTPNAFLATRLNAVERIE